jgi:multiple sugar transport system permease protein
MMTVQHTDERRPLAFTVTRRRSGVSGKRTLAALLLLVLFAPFLWMVIMSLRPSMDAST